MLTYGLDVDQFREHIVRPVLQYLDMDDEGTLQVHPAAENLLIGTALTESRLIYLHQLGAGPAQGVFQMEPNTETDIWDNYLKYRSELRSKVEDLMFDAAAPELVGNLYYQAAMCRVHYRRVPSPLPNPGDAEGMARYWKQYYNTQQGAGTVEKALPHFQKACG